MQVSQSKAPGRASHLGHGTPDLSTLDVGDVAGTCEVKPVGLVELGANEEVQITDTLVLAHQRRRQAQLAVRLHYADHLQ